MMDEDFVERRPADLEIYRRLDAFAQCAWRPMRQPWPGSGPR